MPVYVPAGLPAAVQARAEGLPVCEGPAPAASHPLRVLLLNLMPDKTSTELDFVRMLAPSPRVVELVLMKIAGQTYKHTPQEHMQAFYRDFEELSEQRYAGFIVTGTPVEHLPFEQVRYWAALQRIFNWTRRNVQASLYICWGSQAGLYHHYGVPKHPIAHKMFGIYRQTILVPSEPLFEGMGSSLLMPQSRHTEIRATDVARVPALQVVAASPVSGLAVVKAHGGRELFVTGHMEYAPERLDVEYRRDLSLHRPISRPVNYYRADDPEQAPVYSWRADALRFYGNWLEHYAAQPL